MMMASSKVHLVSRSIVLCCHGDVLSQRLFEWIVYQKSKGSSRRLLLRDKNCLQEELEVEESFCECVRVAVWRVMAISVRPLLSSPAQSLALPYLKSYPFLPTARASLGATKMSAQNTSLSRVIDSHLHVWASPDEAVDKYPYSPGQEPTLPGHVDFLLECMEKAGVNGALIVQPINHKFDHAYVSSVLNKYPSKFVGCCLANPAEDGSGVHQLENLVQKDGFCAVRFNPYLWPDGQLMTNEIGRKLFAKAGELGVPVGFMCMKGLNRHISEIERLCTDYPCTTVLLDHIAFCKPPKSNEESAAFSNLVKLSKFPQVYVKFSAMFRVSREPFPYQDLSTILSQLISNFGANHVMWGSDFPFVVPECGYKEAKEAASLIAKGVALSSTELEFIMGETIAQLFLGRWRCC